MNDVSTAILNLKEILNVKNDSDIADKLGVARNSISGMKKRNSIGAFFEKTVEIENQNISFDALFLAKKAEELNCYILSKQAITLASAKNDKLKELETFLQNFVERESTLAAFSPLIQSIKGKNFLEYWSGKGERMLIVLYYFLKNLEQQDIDFKNVKDDFIKSLEQFNIPIKSKVRHLFAFGENDKKNLIDWAKSNLDEVACFEIINAIPLLTASIKENLNLPNKLVID